MRPRRMTPGTAAVTALALLTALTAAEAARAQGWGEVKGQVVWGPAALPAKKPVAGAPPACLAKGPIDRDEYVVNPKNNGVRWVLVYLVDADKPNAPLPIHPALAAVPAAPVVIDQPCCQFEPRVLGVREGQPVDVKNSAAFAHNFSINGGPLGPVDNLLIPPNGGVVRINAVKARPLPIPFSCSIHPWMRGYLASFKHPYFAVTDADGQFTITKAPAGKYRLIVWQETKGYVLFDEKAKTKGPVVVIAANGPTAVGPYKVEP